MSEEVAAAVEAAEPVIAPAEEVAPEVTAEQPEQQEQPPEQKPDRIAKRFSELSGQRDAAKQEAEYWRQQALARQAEPEPAQEYDDTPFSPEAIQAQVQRALAEERQKAAQQTAQQAQAQKAQSLQAKLFESGLEGAVLIASGANIPFSDTMIDALAESEQAAQVAHHLGTNPAEAARIAALPPHRQGYELAKLEGRLASQPRTTNAPAPPTLVGARGNPATGLRDDMNIDDWVKNFRSGAR